jgi:phosphohistidine swiveling domain-containing protein
VSAILWIHEVGNKELPLVGGKAANLGELTRAGFPVPRGFVVTAQAYNAAVAQGPLGLEIMEALRAIDYDHLASLLAYSSFIRRKIETLSWNPELEAELARRYKRLTALGNDALVAVRSSSTAEDIIEASSAGQQDSYLNVRGILELSYHVKKCWASLWTERAISYRHTKGIPHFRVSMGVVVQQMVQSEVSGIMFTQNPVTLEDHIVIEASWGLGQAIVSGMVDPDRYIVHKDTGQVLDESLADKAQAIILRSPQGGVQVEEVTEGRREQRALSPEDLQRLAEMGREIEKHYRWPQDIEWGMTDNRLFILQSRPVTTVHSSGASGFFTQILGNDDLLWTSGFLNERFKRPVSPLGWSVIQELIEEFAFREPLRFVGFGRFDDLPLTKLYLGHPFVNVRVFQMLYKHFPRVLLPDDASRFFPGGNTAMRKEVPVPTTLQFFLAALRTFLTDPNWHPFNYIIWRRFVEKYEGKELPAAHARLEQADSIEAIQACVEDLLAASSRLLKIHRWSLTYAEVFYGLLKKVIGAWTNLPPEITCAALVAGLPNKSAQRDQALWSLAVDASRLSVDPALIPLSHGPGESTLRLPRSESEEAFLASLESFLEEYGHRRSENLDIFHPSYLDEPEGLLQVIREMIRTQGAQSPQERQGSQREHCARQMAAVRQQLSAGLLDRLIPVRRLIFNLVLSFAQTYMQLREEQRHYWEKALHLKRQAFVKIGDLLVRHGLLGHRGDIFFLTHPELGEFVEGAMSVEQVEKLISTRKREFSRIQHMFYPYFLKGNLPLQESKGVTGSDGQLLHGVAVSPGKARGTARVVASGQFLHETLSHIVTGDILVVTSLDPAWTPVFLKVGGLVVEYGGLLSHGAVVAREYGVPMVARVPRATRIIKEGQEILVDGQAGTVRLLP